MLPALIVGVYTAWHLGVRTGVIAAALIAGALLVASIVPGLGLAVWGLVLAWCALLYFAGPALAGRGGVGSAASVARKAGGVWSQVRRRFDGRR